MFADAGSVALVVGGLLAIGVAILWRKAARARRLAQLERALSSPDPDERIDAARPVVALGLDRTAAILLDHVTAETDDARACRDRARGARTPVGTERGATGAEAALVGRPRARASRVRGGPVPSPRSRGCPTWAARDAPDSRDDEESDATSDEEVST